MIRLIQALDDKTTLKILKIMEEEPSIKEIFNNRVDRLATSFVSCLIYKDDEEVGFFNLVEEKQTHDFYFLDMGIKREYQGQGIAKEVNKRISNLKGIDRYIIVETQEDNLNAVSSLENSDTAIRLFDKYGSIYYLLQKEQYLKFIDDNGLEKLAEHIEKDRDEKVNRIARV